MAQRIEKTVFISYRRTNFPWALNIYQDLTHHGYDVFFDYQSIDSGDFEKIILDNIRARAHFIVVLTPSALERCKEPDDWLRREIETAIDEKRNIVPLMMEGFDFGSPLTTQALTGKLAALSGKNGLPIYAAYFFEGMEKLRNRYLNIALEDMHLHALTRDAKEFTETVKVAANQAPSIATNELSAQEWFERGYKFQEAKDLEEAIRCFTEAIRLEPGFLEAYGNRGNVFMNKGDAARSIADYDQVLVLKPNDPVTYFNRALARKAQGNLDAAISDFNEAIRLKPDYARAYNNRGNVLSDKGDTDGAIKDYDEAIRIKSDYAIAYNNRGIAYAYKGNLDKAVSDYNMAIQLKPDYADAYHGRAKAWESMKNFQAAIADFQKYLELGGDIFHNDRKIIEETIQALEKKIKWK
ncbi:MAG TPA: tetratricopeptide repeat protein [Anaerolineales bacterium]|nr:tetratricopeptide repeat protein [Anaerolineales bacterium]